jgi:hypothetical protein
MDSGDDYISQAAGIAFDPNDSGDQYLLNSIGADTFNQLAQQREPPPAVATPAAKPPASMLDYSAAMGEAFFISANQTVDTWEDSIPRLMHDFALTYDVPLTQGDDEYRKFRDDIATTMFAGDKNQADLYTWEQFGKPFTNAMLNRGKGDGSGRNAFGQLDMRNYVRDTMAKRHRARSPEVLEFWGTGLASNVGGTAPYLVLGLIPGSGGLLAVGGMAALAQSNEAYVRARELGAPFEDALVGGLIAGAPAAATAGLSTKFVLGQKIAGLPLTQKLSDTYLKMAARWNKASGGKFQKMMDGLNRHAVGRVGTAAAAEGFQEILEQLFVNFGVMYATDADMVELNEVIAELQAAGKGGAEVGGLIRGAVELMVARRGRGETHLSPKIGDRPVLDEETGEVLPFERLSPEQTERIAPILGTADFKGIEPEPQRYIDAQFSAMLDESNNKYAVFVADGSPAPSPALFESASKVIPVKIKGEGGASGTVYTRDQGIASALTIANESEGGVTEATLDQILYGMGKGKPTSPDAVVVRLKDKEGNVILSRLTEKDDVDVVQRQLQRQIPGGTIDVVTPAEELTQRIEARKPDVKQQTIADKYFDQALNEQNLPRDVRVNELAAIIAAEEKIDIGIATAVARNVRGRLDQGVPVEPQYAKVVTIDPFDQKTWPSGVTQEQAVQLRRSQQLQYIEQYEAYQAASGPTPEETAQQRLEGVVGGPEAEAQRAARTEEIKKAQADRIERERLDSKRVVGESYRKYQDELREEDLRTQAKVLALEKSSDPTERDVAAAYRELTEQYKLSPEARDAEQQRLKDDYDKLLEQLRAKEQAAEKAAEGAAKEQETKALEEYMQQQRAANPELTQRDETRLTRDFLAQYRSTPYKERRAQEKESSEKLDKLRAWYKSREADATKATEQAPVEQRNAALKAYMEQQEAADPYLSERDVVRLEREFLEWYDSTPYKERKLLEKEGAESRKQLNAWYRAREKAAEQEAKSAPAKQRQAALDAYMQEQRVINPGMVEGERKRLERDFLKWYDSSPTDLRNREMAESRYDLKRLKKQYQELVAKQDAAEAARKAEIQAEVKRRKEAGELTEREAEELQALLLPEAETKAREEWRTSLREQMIRTAKEKDGAPQQTETARAFEDQIRQKAGALVQLMEQSDAQAQQLLEQERKLEQEIAALETSLDEATALAKAEAQGIGVPVSPDRAWSRTVVATQRKISKAKVERENTQTKRLGAEETRRKTQDQLQKLLPDVFVGTQPEPLAATEAGAAPANAAKGKYNVTPEQAGVVLAKSMPDVYGGAKIGFSNFLKRMLQIVAQSPNGVTVDTLMGEVPKSKDEDVGQRRERVLQSLALMRDAGLLVSVLGERTTYALSLDAAQKIGQQQAQASVVAPEGTSFGRPTISEKDLLGLPMALRWYANTSDKDKARVLREAVKQTAELVSSFGGTRPEAKDFLRVTQKALTRLGLVLEPATKEAGKSGVKVFSLMGPNGKPIYSVKVADGSIGDVSVDTYEAYVQRISGIAAAIDQQAQSVLDQYRQGPSFARGRTADAAASFPAAGQPAKVGEALPGKTAYEYRLNSALTASPYVDLQMSAPDVRLEAGPALDTTAEQLAQATDEQLQVMINSEIAVGLEPEAAETKVDPTTGIPIVTSTKPRVVALPKKTTSLATWIAHRTLAQGELRRRAAATARKNDAARSARAADSLRRDSAFGKPRMSYDSLRGADTTLGERMGQPIIEMGDAPGFEGASLTGTLEPTLTNPPAAPVTKIDLRDAVVDLANAVVAPLVTAEMSGTPYVGRYDLNGVVRTANKFNFHVTLHEIGHALVARVFGAGIEGVTALDAAMPAAVRAEMTKLGKLVYPSSIPPAGGHMHEGVAEFVMGSIIRPEAYNAAYPETSRWLADLMQKNPDIGKAYDQAVSRFTAYRFQGFEKISKAAQVKRKSKPWKQRVKELLTLSFYERELVNSMVGTRLQQKDAIAKGKKIGLSKNELDRLRVNDMNEALAAINANLLQTWMSVGMTDGHGNVIPGSQSLEMALDPMRRKAGEIGETEQASDFSDYLYAKRAIALYESDRAVASPDGINPQRATIIRLEKKYGEAIKLSHAQFMAWWGHAIDYVKANDPLFAEVFDSIAKYEEATGTTGTYVPLQRVIYDMATGQSADTGLAAVFDVRRAGEDTVSISGRGTEGKLRGSVSPINDVLQESEANLQALLTLVHKRMAIRNVINVADVMKQPHFVTDLTDIDEGGALPDPASTPSGKAAASMIDVGDSANIAALREMGLNAAQDVNSDDRVIVDYVDVQDVTTTTPDGRTVVTKKPIKRRYSIHKDLAIAVAAMKPQEVMQAWRSHWALGVLQGATSAFKLFATGLNYKFQLIAAPLMDFGTTYMNGTQPWFGLKALVDYPAMYLRLAAAEVGVKYEPYEQYKRMAGSFDSPWSATMSKSSIEYVMMTRGQRIKHLLTLPNIVKPNSDLWRLAERKFSFPSRIGRMLEMQQALKQAGYSGEGPISQEQWVAATVALRRVTTNWSVSGRTAGELNRYLPYFNVTFVTTRDFFRNAAKQMGDPRTRIQYGIKMAGLMGMAMAYWAMAHDDEDPAMKEAYENASYEDRLRYWIFGYKTEEGTTEVLRIPNPMTEFLPAKLLVAVLDGMSSRDPYYAANQTKAFINAFMPALMPQFVQAGLENAANVNDLNKWVVDKGFTALGIESNEMHSPVEPALAQGPSQERVTPYTTEVGIYLSEALNGAVSPRQADHIIEGFIAGAADNLATLLELEGPQTPEAAKQAPGYGSMWGGGLTSKTGPFTMRSPIIQQLAMMKEMADKRKASTRIPETLPDYIEYRALNEAWDCVSALHYISQNHPTMARAQRQEFMRLAVTIAQDVTEKVKRKAAPEEYKQVTLQAKLRKAQKEQIQTQKLESTPGYKPSIPWGNLEIMPR